MRDETSLGYKLAEEKRDAPARALLAVGEIFGVTQAWYAHQLRQTELRHKQQKVDAFNSAANHHSKLDEKGEFAVGSKGRHISTQDARKEETQLRNSRMEEAGIGRWKDVGTALLSALFPGMSSSITQERLRQSFSKDDRDPPEPSAIAKVGIAGDMMGMLGAVGLGIAKSISPEILPEIPSPVVVGLVVKEGVAAATVLAQNTMRSIARLANTSGGFL